MIKKFLVLVLLVVLVNACIFIISDSPNLIMHLLASILFILNYLIIIILIDIRKFVANINPSSPTKEDELTAQDHPIIKSARERLRK